MKHCCKFSGLGLMCQDLGLSHPSYPTAYLIQAPKAVLPGTDSPREKNHVLKSNCRRKGESVSFNNSQAVHKKCQLTVWALTFMPKSKEWGCWESALGQAWLWSLWTRLPTGKVSPLRTCLWTHRGMTDPEAGTARENLTVLHGQAWRNRSDQTPLSLEWVSASMWEL